ncbi:MAG: biotin-dependent carboxyltransferase family protein [Clostridia bacterium]|nr:biotin-dependent carboxyltransferase family protein [Clostridia bacterium]
MTGITVINAGSLSTVQDGGRYGYMSLGFSPSGAMDTYSMKLANLLVSNSLNEAVIEMTLLGMTLRFECNTVIALTGADMSPEINGKPIETYTSVEVNAGDLLTMKLAKSGLRSYLAVAGGFDIPEVMGSASTNLKCSLGGFEGRKLRAGDFIPLRHSIPLSLVGERRVDSENDYPSEYEVRVLLGPQASLFTEKGIEDFFSKEYTVSDKSDRMGVRLEGDPVESLDGVDIISDGMATGSVQITSAGTPIIMMSDRQTTGGYAKIATVITADLKLIAQARAGDKLRFVAVSEKKAVSLLKRENRKFKLLQYRFLCAAWRY